MTKEQLEILKKLAEEKNYGRGPGHAKQIEKLTQKIYDELVRLDILKNNAIDKQILAAAALLHDTGLPEEPHNEIAFDFLSKEIPKRMVSKPLTQLELETIVYCILWHRDKKFSKRGAINITNTTYTKKMAAVLRVADALDRTLQQLVEDVSLRLENKYLIVAISSKFPIKTEINRAKEKADLMKEAFALTEVCFEQTK